MSREARGPIKEIALGAPLHTSSKPRDKDAGDRFKVMCDESGVPTMDDAIHKLVARYGCNYNQVNHVLIPAAVWLEVFMADDMDATKTEATDALRRRVSDAVVDLAEGFAAYSNSVKPMVSALTQTLEKLRTVRMSFGRETHELQQSALKFGKVAGGKDFSSAVDNLARLADTLERLDKYKDSGVLRSLCGGD